MNADEMNDADWFPETFSEPCRIFRAVLNDPCLVETIAKIRCAHELSPSLRGDGKQPGHSIVTYGFPLVFPDTVSHPRTRFLAELARITPPEKTRGVRFTAPCETAIAEAMKSVLAALATRLRETAETVEDDALQ